MEVGTPASGIGVACSANALMPRHGHLLAGTWARDHSLRRQGYPIPRDRELQWPIAQWCFLPVSEHGPGR